MLRGASTRQRTLAGVAVAAGVGVLCSVLVLAGNPANMGICGACFLRDVAGAVGLNSAGGPKIFRPEIVGLFLGALLWMLLGRRYEARSGSNAVTRFFFGVWMAFAALVFLGCPFRMLQRIGGGDLNAFIALPGFVGGVGVGLLFERRGYSVGATRVVAAPVGLLGPVSIVLVAATWFAGGLLVGPGPGDAGGPAHAAWPLSLGLALVAGAALSATGLCAVSAARQVFLPEKRMLAGVAAVILAYGVVMAFSGRLHFGMEAQPIAHTASAWNILAGALLGLTGVLAGGCPVRQIVMAGEGNGDAFLTVVGVLVGGALAHNLGIASTGAGPTDAGRWAVGIGLALALAYGAAMARGRSS